MTHPLASLRSLAVLGAIVVVSACNQRGSGTPGGAGPGPGPGGGSPIPMAMFCDEVLEVDCEANLRCCMDPAGTWSSESACVSARRAECTMLFSGAAFEDGRIRYDADAAGDAVASARAMAADCGPIEIESGLRAVLRGTVTAGGDCTPTESDFSPVLACAPGLGCHVAADGMTFRGTCRATVGAGQSCEMNPCEEGLDCNSDRICAAPGADGAPCTFGSDCESDFCSDGVCAPDPAPTGDSYCDDDAM